MTTLPIRMGDTFKTASGTWEVIAKHPFGRVELFDRERARFLDTYQKQIRTWHDAIHTPKEQPHE